MPAAHFNQLLCQMSKPIATLVTYWSQSKVFVAHVFILLKWPSPNVHKSKIVAHVEFPTHEQAMIIIILLAFLK